MTESGITRLLLHISFFSLKSMIEKLRAPRHFWKSKTLFFNFLVMMGIGSGCSHQSPTSPVTIASRTESGFRLTDVAANCGLDFRHNYGSRSPITIVEAMGSGCAFFDFDNDGWQDIFLISAGQDFQKTSQVPACKLYHNNGDGTFKDVTAQSGIVIDGYAMGCCVGDYDNDGLDDLFVTGFGRNWLFRNLGNGKFKDVTKEAGILPVRGAWGMGCAFVDVNRDGLLDLYVANYVKYDPKIPLCPSATVMHGCTPNQYATQANELYMNIGHGKFVEKAKLLGADDPSGAGLGVIVCDFDEDGWPDILVANDGTPNALLHNEKGHFRNVGLSSGVAYGEGGVMRAGMGVDVGDYDGDGHFDIVVSNFQHEPESLFHNDKLMAFTDVSYASGIGAPTLNRLKFGVVFADLNGDGKLDLYIGNGHVYDNVSAFDDSATFEQKDQILINQGGGRFVESLPDAGAYSPVPSVTRSVASGDFNNDGATDILINSLGRPVRLLENHFTQPRHWLGIKLQGVKSNRSAIGARLELRSGLDIQVREVRSGGSYLAQSDQRSLFNLSSATDLKSLSLSIAWPSGKRQAWKPSRIDCYTTIREPL